jgi:hypothetical protein
MAHERKDAQAWLRTQSREAAEMSSARKAAFEENRRQELLAGLAEKKRRKEEKVKLDIERSSALVAKLAPDAEKKRRRKEHRIKQGKRRRFSKESDEPEIDLTFTEWDLKQLKRNETLKAKQRRKEQSEYVKAMEKLDEEKRAVLEAKNRNALAKADARRRDNRAAAAEAIRRKNLRQESTSDVEQALGATGQRGHLGWVGRLSPESRASWGSPWVSLHVIADVGRAGTSGLERLLASLKQADYLEDEVDLFVHLDAGPHQQEAADIALAFEWPFGFMNVSSSSVRKGLLRTILGAWKPRDADEIGIILEDDHEVSPLFYAWVKYSTLTYRYDSLQRNRLSASLGGSKLYGVSLYTPKVSTTQFPKQFHPFDLFKIRNNPQEGMSEIASPYLHQLPCGGGAFAFFADAWVEFTRYSNLRIAWAENPRDEEPGSPEVVGVHVFSRTGEPSRTNDRTWKWLHLLEMATARNGFFLYPNFPFYASFSTSHLEERRRSGATLSSSLSLFGVPLIGGNVEADFLSFLPGHTLPDAALLPQLDVFNEVIGDVPNFTTTQTRTADDDDDDVRPLRFSANGTALQAVVKWRAVPPRGEDPQQCPISASSTFSGVVVVSEPTAISRFDISGDVSSETPILGESLPVDDASMATWGSRGDCSHNVVGCRYGLNQVRTAIFQSLAQTYTANQVVVTVPDVHSAVALGFGMEDDFNGAREASNGKKVAARRGVPRAVQELSLGVFALPRLLVTRGIIDTGPNTKYLAAVRFAMKSVHSGDSQQRDLAAAVFHQGVELDNGIICRFLQAYDELMQLGGAMAFGPNVVANQVAERFAVSRFILGPQVRSKRRVAFKDEEEVSNEVAIGIEEAHLRQLCSAAYSRAAPDNAPPGLVVSESSSGLLVPLGVLSSCLSVGVV